LFLFTCATTGRPEHGTKRSDTGSSPLTSNIENWDNYYLNLTEMDIRQAVNIDEKFHFYEFIVNGFDLYFWGIKK
jgi:alpha-galactosidase